MSLTFKPVVIDQSYQLLDEVREYPLRGFRPGEVVRVLSTEGNSYFEVQTTDGRTGTVFKVHLDTGTVQG